MAVKIRLKRMGKVRAPHYRVVVVDSRKKRDGKVIEEIGHYHPKEEPSFIRVESERVQHWLSVGAQPSEAVAAILKVTGDWQTFKGEPGTEGTYREPEPKRDKAEIFNEALKEAGGDAKAEAVTKKSAKADKKADKAEGKADDKDKKADKAEKSDEAPAPNETPASESPEGAAEEAEAAEPAETAAETAKDKA